VVEDARILDFLREQFARVNGKLDNVVASVLDLSRRVTSFESQGALLHGDFANQSIRIDRREAGWPAAARQIKTHTDPR
jgi:phosphoglycerate-specific signal transduction histidine kinase